ncbi:DUF4397 domain-containing protein [Mucilaginibacter calamicampi]|uniref:DUF4397 domain-containing protein n=1 Tax=Mucilaginibacter calamicampi TaxID=1302352 RepID=A0ABW2YVD2_9SPHI
MTSTFKTKTNRTLSILLAFASLATIFSSCSKTEENKPMAVAGLAVTNAASASAAQDVYFDNQRVTASALAYTQTAGYFSVAGSPTISFRTANTTDVYGSGTTSLTPGKYYNAFLSDDKNVTVYENDLTPPQSGKARIRFINLSSGVGSNADFGIAGGAKIVSGLTYRSASAYQDVDPTSGYSLYTGGSSSVLLAIPVTLTVGGIYTLYISGSTNTTVGFKLIGEN